MKQNGNQSNNNNKKEAKQKTFKACALHIFNVFEQGISRITNYEIRIINEKIMATIIAKNKTKTARWKN